MRSNTITFKNDETVSRSGNIFYHSERLNLMHGSSRTLPTLTLASIPTSARSGISVHDNVRFLSTSTSTLIAPDLESDMTPSTLSSAASTPKTTSPSSTSPPILDLITAIKESTPASDFQSLFPDIPASFVDSTTRDPFSTPRPEAPWRNSSMSKGSATEEALRKSVYQRDPIDIWWPRYEQVATQWRGGVQLHQQGSSGALVRTDFLRFIGALKVAPVSSHSPDRLKKLKRIFDDFHCVIHTPKSNAKVYSAFLETLHFWKMYDLIPEWTQRIKSMVMTTPSLTMDSTLLERGSVQARYHDLIHSLANANQVEEIVRCLEELKASRSDTLRPTTEAYDCLLETYMKRKDTFSAMRTFQEMRNQGIEPRLTTFNILLRGHLENKDTQATQSVLESLLLTDLRPDIYTFNLLMSGYLDIGDVERVNGFYKGLGEYGLTPNSKTYRILMKSHMRQGQVDQVLDMFCKLSESRQPELQPGSEDYRILIQTLANHGRMSDALRVLRELTVTGKVALTTPIYNVFLTQYAREGQVEKAQKVLDRIIAEKLPLIDGSFNPLIRAYLARKDFDKVGEMTELMYRYGIQPSRTTFNIMINSTKASGNLDRAMTLFERMAIEGVEPDIWTYNSLLTLHVRKLLPARDNVRWKGDTAAVTREQIEEYVPRIEKLLQQMKDRGIKPDIVTYSNLIHQYVILHDVEQAEMVFHEMVKSGISPNTYVFNTLMNGFAQIEEMDKAVELFRRMPKYGVEPDATTFTTLIKGYANTKQMTRAKDFATSLQRRSSKIPMDQHCLHTLMQLAQKSHQPGMALDFFEMMRGRGMEPDKFTFTILLNSLSRDYSESSSKAKSGSKSRDRREGDPGTIGGRNSEAESTVEAVESILAIIQRNGYPLHHPEITTMISAYFRLGRPLAAIEFFKTSFWRGNPRLSTTNCGALFHGLLAPEFGRRYDGIVLNLYTRMLSGTREMIQAGDEQRRRSLSTEVNNGPTTGASWPTTPLSHQSEAPHQFPVLDLVTINILFQAFSKRKNWTIVLQLWRDLESIGAENIYPFEMPLEFLGWAAQAYFLTPDHPEDLAALPSLSSHKSVSGPSSRKPHQQQPQRQERERHSEMAEKLLRRLWNAHHWMGVEWSIKIYGCNIFESQTPTLSAIRSSTVSAGGSAMNATNHCPSSSASSLLVGETRPIRRGRQDERGEIEDKRAQDEQQQQQQQQQHKV